MPATLTHTDGVRQHNRLEDVRPEMAKADLKNVEALERRWRERVGAAVLRAIHEANLTQKEFGGLLDRDQGQIARWIAGAENVNLGAILSRPELRLPMIFALCGLAEPDGVELHRTVRFPSKARTV